jgi:hypothetical protein
MSTIHLHQTTTLTPEQYIAGLTGLISTDLPSMP